MHPFFYKVLFRKAGKPRSWTRVVLFRRDRTARTLFYPIIHKKSGALRPHWAYWVADASKRGPASNAPEQERSSSERHLAKQLGPAEQALSQLRRFDQTVASWRRNAPVAGLLSVEAILNRLRPESSAGIVLSASHDNYRENPGGVQLCIQREEQTATSRGWAYLQFHPWEPLPSLAPDTDGRDLPVTILLNGTQIGTATMSSLTAAVERCVGAGHPVRLVVHHLLGHSSEALARLAHAAQVREVPFWLHDFFAMCPSYTLRRNGLAFCGAPAATSNACGLCVFGPARPFHQARIAAFFQSLPIVAVAPSQVTADFWSSKSDLLVQGLAVIPHVILEERPRATPAPIDAGAPITVGFLGAAVDHKGWSVFLDKMSRHSGPMMRFVVLSSNRPGQGENAWQRVHVTAETPDAMSKAIVQSKVDVVLHWANWPETFSFTTFEALSAGAFVLTNPVSGNVQATVRATGRGAVLDDQAALDIMFADGSLAQMVAKRRAIAATTDVVPRLSAISFDLPGWT